MWGSINLDTKDQYKRIVLIFQKWSSNRELHLYMHTSESQFTHGFVPQKSTKLAHNSRILSYPLMDLFFGDEKLISQKDLC